jgi:predicted molibdopterin-dependent oxidoreductase YjgC
MSLPYEDRFFNIEVDGQLIPAYHGQTIAAALMAAGRRIFRYTQTGTPRGLFCGMGVCFDCLVAVDDGIEKRACITLARPGMRIHLLNGKEGDSGGD